MPHTEGSYCSSAAPARSFSALTETGLPNSLPGPRLVRRGPGTPEYVVYYQANVAKVWLGWLFWYHRSIPWPSFQLYPFTSMYQPVATFENES